MSDRRPFGTAYDRVKAFLDARDMMGGPIDHETIYHIGVAGEYYELTRSDLRELLAAWEAFQDGIDYDDWLEALKEAQDG